MKGLVVFVCFLIFLSAVSCESDRFVNSDHATESLRIKEMLQELEKATAARDTDWIESFHLYGPRFTRVSQNGRRLTATQSRASEKEYYSTIEEFSSEFEDLKIDVFDETAIVTGIFSFEGRIGENTFPGRALGTLVLVKVNGEWKIVYEGLSEIEPVE
jgi:ketosteroid isomerase-like protein